MPYTRINWIKLKLELLSEHRFIEECDDLDKLLFIGLLMLAGLTSNKIPKDAKYIKRMLNLQMNEHEITKKITKIEGLFQGLSGNSHFLKFKGFNKLHNYVGKPLGSPEDSLDKIRVEKIRIDKIVNEFLAVKGWNKDQFGFVAKRWGRPIKELLLNAKDEDALDALRWTAEKMANVPMWGMEAVLKWYPEWEKSGKKSDKVKALEKEYGNKRD